MICDKRGVTRHQCRMRVEIRTRGRDYLGYLLNVSKGGMRLSTDEVAEIWTGDRVEVTSEEFGLVTGVARWRAPGQFGVRFNNSTNNSAKLNAMCRFFRLPA
jgi:hypothetical protein